MKKLLGIAIACQVCETLESKHSWSNECLAGISHIKRAITPLVETEPEIGVVRLVTTEAAMKSAISRKQPNSEKYITLSDGYGACLFRDKEKLDVLRAVIYPMEGDITEIFPGEFNSVAVTFKETLTALNKFLGHPAIARTSEITLGDWTFVAYHNANLKTHRLVVTGPVDGDLAGLNNLVGEYVNSTNEVTESSVQDNLKTASAVVPPSMLGKTNAFNRN